MITSIHTLVYSDDAPATRRFFREVLDLPFVEHAGSGDGWLIFRTGPSELGVHPTSVEWQGSLHTSPRHHEISLMCVDIDATKAGLEAKGAVFEGEIADHGYGKVAMLTVPGIDTIQLYEPSHPTAYDL